jgi:hypothetical protein
MPDINYVNPQINNIVQQELSIQVSLSGFSFIIRASETKDCLLFRNYGFDKIQLLDELIRKTDQLISDDKYLKKDFVKTDVVFIDQKATLIPEEFFKPEDLKSYFEFNHNLNELDELHYQKIPSVNAYIAFSLPNYLTNIFYKLFRNISFNHQANNLINLGVALTNNSEYTVLAAINKGFFDITVFEKKSLILYNSFQYTNALDFIYFFLYSLNQLKIDPLAQDLIVLGEISKHKDVLLELNSRVKNVIQPNIDSAKLCKQLSKLQKLEFYNLLQ